MNSQNIYHPLSSIFSAKHYEMNRQNMSILFYDCYLHKRFYYPHIEWDIQKNVLRFYTNNSKKEIKCLKISLENCSVEQSMINPREMNLFINNCRYFMREMATNRDEIKHMAFRKFPHDNTKLVMFLGEEHFNASKRVNRFVDFMMKYFDSFKRIPGMIIDFFIEVEYNRNENNFEYDRYPVYTPLYQKLKNSSHVRYHQIDYRGASHLTPLNKLFMLFYKQAKKVASNKGNQPKKTESVRDQFTKGMYFMYGYLDNILPTLEFQNFEMNNPVLVKQFKKIKRTDVLRKIFREYFERAYKTFKQLMDDMDKYVEIEERVEDKYKREREQELFSKKIKNNICLKNPQYIVSVFSRFMDIYTIGRLLKPGYNYCVVYGGAFHTTDILKTMEKYNLISSSKDPSFYELVHKISMDHYSDLSNDR